MSMEPSEEPCFQDAKLDMKLEIKLEKCDSLIIASESAVKIAVEKETEFSNNVISDKTIPYADDEEDVPSDFFDDFSNQDFMAGLDIVDAWDEEEFMIKDKARKLSEIQIKKRKRSERDRNRRRHTRSPIPRNHRSKGSPGKSYGSRDRKDKKSKENPRDKNSKEGEEQSLDHRRDPEKTKRDIQKDKDKCAKNKEAKIISEKLKVVETGLVPPGTEMEVDLKELAKSKEPEKKSREEIPTREERRPEKLREDRHNKHEEKSYERHRRSISIERARKRRSRTRSPRPPRDRSYEHRPRLRSRSPYRGRSRTRSPYYRDRSRERERRRLSSERRAYLEERKRFARYRNTSPTIIRRTSRERSLELSPVSNISERELWLRQREKQKRDRKISGSPISDSESNRRRSQDFLEELANKLKSDQKKRSFLKEIQERLNEPSQVAPRYSMRSGPGPRPYHSGPVPPPGMNLTPNHNNMHGLHTHSAGPGIMPGPQFFQPDPAPQYDQQFFIGQPDVFHNPNPYEQSFGGHVPVPTMPPMLDSRIIAHPILSPIPSHPLLNKNNVDLLKAQKAAEAQKEKDQEAVAKLFEDKKISLSDFLSVSAKHTDPLRPVNVQKKIKVISLCQDAIKSLGGDSKLNGRFFPKKTYKDQDKKEETKFQSPLRKIPVVRFSFTTPSKGGDDKSTLQTASNKLLASLGLAEPPRLPTPKPALSPVSSEASVKSIPVKHVATPAKTITRKYDPILGAKFQMKMCQTDPTKCDICEIRKARTFTNRGTQCAINTVDSETQITEEDMQRFGIKPPMKDAFKNQSLAHLTPAQILAAQPGGLEESPKKDIFGSRMMIPTPPAPDMSPEKRGMLSNDNFPNRADRFNKPDHFNSSSNNVNRPGGFKQVSIFDKLKQNTFENVNRFEGGFKPNHFKNVGASNFDRSHIMQQTQQHNEGRFRGRGGISNQPFNQRQVLIEDEFDYDQQPNNYGGVGGNNNQRFLPNNRGNFFPKPYGGRKF